MPSTKAAVRDAIRRAGRRDFGPLLRYLRGVNPLKPTAPLDPASECLRRLQGLDPLDPPEQLDPAFNALRVLAKAPDILRFEELAEVLPSTLVEFLEWSRVLDPPPGEGDLFERLTGRRDSTGGTIATINRIHNLEERERREEAARKWLEDLGVKEEPAEGDLVQPDGPAGTETLSHGDLSDLMKKELGEEPGGENLKKRLSEDRIRNGHPLWDLRQGGPYRHPTNGQVYRWAAEQTIARLKARREAHRKAEEKRRRGEERILNSGVERHLRQGDF